MSDHYEELPAGKGFPAPEDVARWRDAFDKLVPGGNTSELIGIKFDDGHLVGVCRIKRDTNAHRT